MNRTTTKTKTTPPSATEFPFFQCYLDQEDENCRIYEIDNQNQNKSNLHQQKKLIYDSNQNPIHIPNLFDSLHQHQTKFLQTIIELFDLRTASSKASASISSNTKLFSETKLPDDKPEALKVQLKVNKQDNRLLSIRTIAIGAENTKIELVAKISCPEESSSANRVQTRSKTKLEKQNSTADIKDKTREPRDESSKKRAAGDLMAQNSEQKPKRSNVALVNRQAILQKRISELKLRSKTRERKLADYKQKQKGLGPETSSKQPLFHSRTIGRPVPGKESATTTTTTMRSLSSSVSELRPSGSVAKLPKIKQNLKRPKESATRITGTIGTRNGNSNKVVKTSLAVKTNRVPTMENKMPARGAEAKLPKTKLPITPTVMLNKVQQLATYEITPPPPRPQPKAAAAASDISSFFDSGDENEFADSVSEPDRSKPIPAWAKGTQFLALIKAQFTMSDQERQREIDRLFTSKIEVPIPLDEIMANGSGDSADQTSLGFNRNNHHQSTSTTSLQLLL